jgi:hypothetical protein
LQYTNSLFHIILKERRKSALFVQANVAVNTKLTSKVPFLFGNFQVFLKNLVKNVQFGMLRRENFFFPPRRQHFGEKFFRCPFRYPKVPLEAGAPPQSFDASYTPVYLYGKMLIVVTEV